MSNDLIEAATKATANLELRFSTKHGQYELASVTGGEATLGKAETLYGLKKIANKYGYGEQFNKSLNEALSGMSGNLPSPTFAAKAASAIKER